MKLSRLLVFGFLGLMIDQVSKLLASKFLPVNYNSGISFGWGGSVSIFLILAILLLVVFDSIKRGVTISDILIISGGLSNIIDRVWRGAVVDWISLFGLWFNLADVAIAAGVALIIYGYTDSI